MGDMSTMRQDSVDGTLTGEKDGQQIQVKLHVTGRSDGSDLAAAEVRLASTAPDGDYVLEYFYAKAYRSKVRVKDGRLVNRL